MNYDELNIITIYYKVIKHKNMITLSHILLLSIIKI